MSRITLLGDPGTKRAAYFQKAAAEAGVSCCLQAWGQPWVPARGQSMKIDPPVWSSCDLGEMAGHIRGYREDLQGLARLGKCYGIHFLNPPETIMELLDKKRCKEKLRQAQIPVTESLKGSETDPARETAHLIGRMMEQHIFQVFIKPRWGSGAAGTAALRIRPGSGEMILYTCAAPDPQTGRLVNTKRLCRFTEKKDVCTLLDGLLKLDHVEERWYAKAGYQGLSYDLRVVMQDGEPDAMLARLSKSPITNLHLNGRPLAAGELGLPQNVMEAVVETSQKAMVCFPGLMSAGIDILLEKGSLRPRVIEMNGQGDLIYQDIYGENKIYRHQVEMMRGSAR